MDHHQIIHNISNPVVIMDVEAGHFVDCNDLALEMFDMSREELLRTSPSQLSPANVYGHEAEAYSRQLIQEALAGANPAFDWIHIDKEGNEIPCEVRLIRFPPYDRNLVRGTIIHKDDNNRIIRRASEGRLILTLESAKIGTFDWYPQADQLSWDKRLYEIFELDPNSRIDLNEHFFSIIHPDDIERVARDFEKSLKAGGPSHNRIEYRVVIDGRVKYILAYSRMIRDDKGEMIRMLGTTQDITELRESEKKLRENEELLDSIIQDQKEMIVRWKPGGFRTFVNKAYCETFGLDSQKAIGESFFERLDKSFKEKFIQDVKSLTPKNPVRIYTIQNTLPSGEKAWQEWSDRAYFDEEGNVIEYQSVGRDVTQVVEAQKALKKSEERYRNVFNQQFQFTALLDLEGKVLHINTMSLKAQGLKREDYLGKYLWDSPSWSGNKAWQKKIKSQVLFAKKTGETITVEDDPFYGQGKCIRWANASYSVIRNNEGKAENILVQAIDVTEEKNAKKEIQEREKQLSMIYENTNDFIILIRYEKDDYVIEEINDSCLKLIDFFGLEISKEGLMGISMKKVYTDLLHFSEEKVNERIQAFDKVRLKKETVSYQQEIGTGKGFLATSVELVPVVEGTTATHLLMIAKDITESYLGQKKLEEAYHQLDSLRNQLEQENIYLKEEIKQANDFENMVFKSEEFREVLKKVEQVAKTNATVLITGETGTGKELIARAIHNVSKRSEKPMIKVNAAAIPKDLIESELFGHEKGAFTGAFGEKPGKFELANGGTIFLDEIGDMPMDLQVKILRVLQEGEVERLGSTQTRKIDVRIISATNKNLEDAVRTGSFREDLYFRLKVFPIEIPPLRSRPDDVPILVEHFVSKYAVKHSNPIQIIPKAVMDYLRNYSWPGNVRELENTIERAVILSTNEKLDLPEVVDSTTTQEQWEHENSLDIVMENHIRKVLKECDWKIEGEDGAAAQLKVKPSTLRDRMKKFNIRRPN